MTYFLCAINKKVEKYATRRSIYSLSKYINLNNKYTSHSHKHELNNT